MSSKVTDTRRSGQTPVANRRSSPQPPSNWMPTSHRDPLKRPTQSSRGDRQRQNRLNLPPATIKHLESDFELEGLAMRVPSPPLREEKKSSIHVRLVETGSNASHTEDLHSFCDMQLRDAKERESTWKKIRTGIEKQNTDLKTVIQEKEKELQLADDKIRELTAAYNVLERDHATAKEEILSLKDKLSQRVKRVDEMFLAHQKEISAMKQEYEKELRMRDEKLELLKSHLEKSMDDKSWERQKQLDELSKELARVTEETEMLKKASRSKAKTDETPFPHCKTETLAVKETDE